MHLQHAIDTARQRQQENREKAQHLCDLLSEACTQIRNEGRGVGLEVNASHEVKQHDPLQVHLHIDYRWQNAAQESSIGNHSMTVLTGYTSGATGELILKDTSVTQQEAQFIPRENVDANAIKDALLNLLSESWGR